MHSPAATRLRVHEPWFRLHPAVTVAVAAMLFAVILVLRIRADDPLAAYSMLYMFPIALLAVTFGRLGGVAGGLTAIALTAVWVLAGGEPLSVQGWLERALPFLVLGALIGDSSDRLREAEAERMRLAAAARMHQEAIEINDSLVQGMSAAKWAIEAGRTESGLAALEETIVRGHEMVSSLIREAGLGNNSAAAPRPVPRSAPR